MTICIDSTPTKIQGIYLKKEKTLSSQKMYQTRESNNPYQLIKNASSEPGLLFQTTFSCHPALNRSMSISIPVSVISFEKASGGREKHRWMHTEQSQFPSEWEFVLSDMQILSATKAFHGSYDHANVIHFNTHTTSCSCINLHSRSAFSLISFSATVRCEEGHHVLQSLITFFQWSDSKFNQNTNFAALLLYQPECNGLTNAYLNLLEPAFTQRNNLEAVLNTQLSLNSLFCVIGSIVNKQSSCLHEQK